MIGQLFDPQAELFIHERLRPHWSQAGAIVFVTFRTKDSIPQSVVTRWEREKQEWIERVLAENSRPLGGSTLRDLPGDFRHWSDARVLLDERQRHDFDFHFNRCRETKLDECLGACPLKRPELARIVADSLLHFDGVRYRLGDFVIMPNHVHLLAAFSSRDNMERQFASWLRFTATKINRQLGLKGHFWQQEPFDHLVRSIAQYEYLRQYIADNPTKVRLKQGEYYYRRCEE